jgi:hypothetical protein
MTTVRWSGCKIFLISIFVFSVICGPDPAEAGQPGKERILLVHDSGDLLPSSTADPVLMMSILLSRFADEVIIGGGGDYSREILSGFDAVVIVSTAEGISELKLPETDIPVVWVGTGIPRNLPLQVSVGDEFFFNFDHVRYKDRLLFAGKQQQSVFLEAGEGAEVLAQATDLQRYVPLAVHLPGMSLWIFSGIPFWEGGEMVFADILYDVFGAQWKKNSMFVRLDGIDPFTDAEQVERVADWLRERMIPFAVSYSPANWEGGTGNLVTIARNRPLVDLLKRFTEYGIPLVMRGFAGNHRRVPYENAAEFWDYENDAPLPEAGKILEERITDGISVSARLGVRPSGFMAPGYKLPPELLDLVGDRFRMIAGRIQTSEMTSEASYVPPFLARVRNMILLPENLGYISRYRPQEDLSLVLSKSLDMTVVRGALGSFAYDPALGVDMLELIVSEMQKQGYGIDFVFDMPEPVPMPEGVEAIEDASGFERSKKMGEMAGNILLIAGGLAGLFLIAVYLRKSLRRRRDLFS